MLSLNAVRMNRADKIQLMGEEITAITLWDFHGFIQTLFLICPKGSVCEALYEHRSIARYNRILVLLIRTSLNGELTVLLPSKLKPLIANVGEEVIQIFFSSTLSGRYYDDLEALMFFNPQQGKLRNAVSQLVDRYGNPKIIEDQGWLRLQIGSSLMTQTLFSFDDSTSRELIGVVVYTRECIEHLTIIHLAVREDYSMSGPHASQHLMLHLIQKVREIGSRLKGVESLRILYSQSLKEIPVRRIVSDSDR